MRAVLLAVVCPLVLSLSASAHAGERGREVADALLDLAGAQATLLPSDIDRSFSELDEANPLDVTYPVTGVRTYDRFFLDLARVQGTLALAQYCIDATNELLDGALVDEVFSGEIFVDAFGRAIDVPAEHRQAMLVALVHGDARAAGRLVRNFSTIQFRQVRENFLEAYGDVGRVAEITPDVADELADLPRTIADLVTAVPDLVTEAPTAFAGANAVHAPRVAASLARAAQDLAQMPDQVTALVQGLGALASSSR